MTKLIVAFHNSVNAPNMELHFHSPICLNDVHRDFTKPDASVFRLKVCYACSVKFLVIT
jgi:hypothetical protein